MITILLSLFCTISLQAMDNEPLTCKELYGMLDRLNKTSQPEEKTRIQSQLPKPIAAKFVIGSNPVKTIEEILQELNERCNRLLEAKWIHALFLERLGGSSDPAIISAFQLAFDQCNQKINEKKSEFCETYNLDFRDFYPGDSPEEYIELHVFSNTKKAVHYRQDSDF